MKHIKPMPGFVVAKLVEKKTKSGLILIDGEKGKKNYSDIVVEAISKKDAEEYPDLKKGTVIFIVPNSMAPQINSEEHGNPALIPIHDIMGYEA